MSTPSKKSIPWFARLGSALGRKRHSALSRQNHRGLRFESLETRSLLSATVLPSISGIVYQDMTGNGLTSDDTRLANVTVNLFRDGGDGVFTGKNVGSDDTLIGTATSDATGNYGFNNLSAGTYFVQEVGVPGLVIAPNQSVQTVVVTSSDLQGTVGTMIDSFASTSQFASGSLHGGKTGTSSQSTPDAIGGHRNLYVQLTSAGGAVSLGANSDFPGLLDFASDAASNGIFWVNWDGNNSNAAVLNPTGLRQVDLTSQGASTGIELNVAGDHDNGFIMLKVFSDANDWSWASVPISNTADGSLSSSGNQFVAFSNFTVGGGTGANFSAVGAIQLAVNGANANDGQVGPIEAVGPMVLSENFANLAQADLAVVKSASPNPVVAGNQLTYTFTTTNNGPSNDTDVILSDTLPAGVQYVSSSSSQGTVTNNNGTLSVQLGSLASGAVATTTVVVTVDPARTGSITNTVTVTGDVTDPNPDQQHVYRDDAGRPIGRPGPRQDRLAQSGEGRPAAHLHAHGHRQRPFQCHGRDHRRYAAGRHYLHLGQRPRLSDGLWPNADAERRQPGSRRLGHDYGRGRRCLDRLGHDHQHGRGQRQPTRSQPGQQHGLGFDPNRRTGDSTVHRGSGDRQDGRVNGDRRLELDLYAGRDQLHAGVRFEPDGDATGVTVVDTLPAGFSYISASSQYSATISGNTLTLNLGTLTPEGTSGDSATITIVGEVTAAAANTITNTATVSSIEQDVNPSNNTSNVDDDRPPSGGAEQVVLSLLVNGKTVDRSCIFPAMCDNTDMNMHAANFILVLL